MSEHKTTDCGACGGSGWVQKARGCGVWDDRQCPVCDGAGKESLKAEQAAQATTDRIAERAAYVAAMRDRQGARGCSVTGGMCRAAGCHCFEDVVQQRDVVEFHQRRAGK